MTKKSCLIQIVTGLFTCVCLAIVAVGQVPDKEFTWRGKIAVGGVVEIIGIKGDIRVETSPVQEVEVVALKQGNQNEFELVSTRVEVSGGRIRICAAYPKLGGGDSECVEGLEWSGTSFQNKELHIWRENESRKKQSFRMVDVRVQL
ncbi:MAG: hypothetical protein L0220_35490, partial [Acidobacteria bacterium]|nr:hypothetical protein [Acidobacteriota bacterium]